MSEVSWVGRRASIGHNDEEGRVFGVVVYGPTPDLGDIGYFTVLFQPDDEDRGIMRFSSKFFEPSGFRLEPLQPCGPDRGILRLSSKFSPSRGVRLGPGSELAIKVRDALALPDEASGDDIIKEIHELRSLAVSSRMG